MSAVTVCDLFFRLTTQSSLIRMPGNSSWLFPRISCGPPGEIGIEALDSAIVQRHHVVFDGLDEPQPLHVGELLGILRSQVVGLGPVVWAIELPGVVVEWRQGGVHVPGVLCLVTAVQPLW